MKKVIGFLIASFCITNMYAQEVESNRESWYTYWGIGTSSFTYPSEVQLVFDLLEEEGCDRMRLNLDMFGFYWHLRPNTIAGVLINGASDRLSIDSDWIQYNYYIFGPSIIHFPGLNFGKGFFLRSDVGLSKIVAQTSEGDSDSSDFGFGLLVGGGWSIDFGGTRMLINANYSYRKIEGDPIKVLGFSVGGLF